MQQVGAGRVEDDGVADEGPQAAVVGLEEDLVRRRLERVVRRRRAAAERSAAEGEAHCVFHLELLVECAVEELDLALRGPALDRGGAVGLHRQADRAVVGVHVRLADALVAASLEVLGEAQEDRHAVQALVVAVVRQGLELLEVRHALAVIAGRLRDERDLARREPRQAGVEDEVARVLVVVVVVDRHADVVQHARAPQELALPAVAGVQAGRGELVEERQGEPRDVLGVGRVDVVARGEVEDRGAAHVVEQRRLAVEQLAEEDALAQAGLGDLDRLVAARFEHRLHDDRPGEDEVGAAVLDPLDRRALGCRQRGELVDEVVELLAVDLKALHAERRLAGLRPAPRRRGCASCRRCRRGAGWRVPARARRPRAIARTCFCSALRCFFVASSPSGRKCSVMRTAPSGHDPTRPGWRLLTSMSCSEPPPRSSTTPSASVVEFTAAR